MATRFSPTELRVNVAFPSLCRAAQHYEHCQRLERILEARSTGETHGFLKIFLVDRVFSFCGRSLETVIVGDNCRHLDVLLRVLLGDERLDVLCPGGRWRRQLRCRGRHSRRCSGWRWYSLNGGSEGLWQACSSNLKLDRVDNRADC